jgi:hypothetical protein
VAIDNYMLHIYFQNQADGRCFLKFVAVSARLMVNAPPCIIFVDMFAFKSIKELLQKVKPDFPINIMSSP